MADKAPAIEPMCINDVLVAELDRLLSESAPGSEARMLQIARELQRAGVMTEGEAAEVRAHLAVRAQNPAFPAQNTPTFESTIECGEFGFDFGLLAG